MTDTLNLFPARIAIGKWRDPDTNKDIPVLMTTEFERALGALFRRVGGPIAFSNDDIAILTAGSHGAAAIANAESRVSQLEQQILALQAQVAAMAQANKRLDDMERGAIYGTQAAVSQQAKRISDLEVLSAAAPVSYLDWTRPGKIGSGTPNTAAFTSVTYSGQLTSTIATGTAPMVVASTTKVANLNVDLLDGGDWASPGAIGSTDPNTGSFTTLATNGTGDSNFGTNTSNSAVNIRGSNSGLAGGTNVNVRNNNTLIIAMGNKSAIVGGAYDATPLLWSNAELHTQTDFRVNGALRITSSIGFFNTAPGGKPTVSGSRGANAALASLLTGLAGLGLVTDSTTV